MRVAMVLFCAGLCAGLDGCSRFHAHPFEEFVYVTAKQSPLRDRVAAVSNRVATVDNGTRLRVLEHGRRFLRVQMATGEIGWIDSNAVATQPTFDAFTQLAKAHEHDPMIASGIVRDEVYLHLEPGRNSEKFYRLAEGDKLSLLERATLAKGAGPKTTNARGSRTAATPSTPASAETANANQTATPRPDQSAIPGAETGLPSGKPAQPSSPAQSSQPAAPAQASQKGAPVPAVPPAVPPVMEDWWLVRDAHGHVGWMLSRMMDVDAPEVLSRYSEGQRFVGAYVLATVYDAEAPQDDKNIPEFVTVLGPYKSGLPYDFDQVRVFTWNPKMHRYETAFREKNIEGYLPVVVKKMQDPHGTGLNALAAQPGFQYKVLTAAAAPVIPDPESGAIVPGATVAKSYRLEGNVIRRLSSPGETPVEEAHPAPVSDKNKKDKKKHR